jgi:hypothetical protein
MRYALLATDHVAWSNSLIEATIDEHKRTIEFGPPKWIDAPYLQRQMRADLDWWQAEIGDYFPVDAFVCIFNDWQRHAEWGTHGLEFSPDFIRHHVRFPDMRAWITRVLFPELDEDCLLGSYNLGHLRTFFAVMQTVCDCIRTLEDEVDKRAEYGAMGTWTFQRLRPEFIEWICEATGLKQKIVELIVADMTLNPTRFHCAISTTPFILSRRNRLFLLPRMFALLSPQRSFAAALTTGSGRKAYDGIANKLEQFHLARLCTLLKRCGLRVLREQSFVTPEGEKLTPDIVVADAQTCEIVIVDFKNSLAATSVAEVTKRLREYNKGIAQIERYIDRLSRFPVLLSSALGLPSLPPSIRGLLLFRVPMPLPVARATRVEVEDWNSMQRRLLSLRQAHLSDLFAPRNQAFADKPTWRFEEIQVADWTYRRANLYWPDDT